MNEYTYIPEYISEKNFFYQSLQHVILYPQRGIGLESQNQYLISLLEATAQSNLASHFGTLENFAIQVFSSPSLNMHTIQEGKHPILMECAISGDERKTVEEIENMNKK